MRVVHLYGLPQAMHACALLVAGHRQCPCERRRRLIDVVPTPDDHRRAAILNLGLSTVETHRGNLMHKLSLHNTAAIV